MRSDRLTRWSRRPLPAAAAATLLAAVIVPITAPAGAAQNVQCSVDYRVTNEWNDGFGAEVSLTNEGSTPLNGWSLTWTYPDGQRITQAWNSQVTQSGSVVTARNVSWNGTVAPGGSATFGFNAAKSGANTAPTDFAVNGAACGDLGEPPVDERTIVSDRSSLSVRQGQSASFALSLAAAPQDDVTVALTRTAGTANLSLETSSLNFDADNWNTGRSVTVTSADSGASPGTAIFTATADGYAPAVITVREIGAAQSDYEAAFLEQYEKIKDPASGYFREVDGLLVPYHSVETLIVEAPDHGHQTTSEAYSYYLWLEAAYARITEDWEPFNRAWESLETFIVPGSEDQPTNAAYDPGSPATYAGESPTPTDYPSPLNPDVPVGEDPLGGELSATYGDSDVYGMAWLLDVDNVYGFGFCGDGSSDEPVFMNSYQRGSNESVWETVPHPSCETFDFGGENGYLDLFTGDEQYSEQWRYTAAPDADARVVQVAYLAKTWAEEQGQGDVIADTVADAVKMGDYLRYAMYDKYFKEIGDCTDPISCPAGSGKNSSHYLLSWYYSWGGALASAEYPWAFRIGGSGVHQGYQNPMAAWALSEAEGMAPQSPTAQQDWAESLDRQLEFIQWLQAPEGGIAGGATNNWEGRYAEPPTNSATFYGLYYDWQPVWNDPPSNRWFGFQAWGMERIAQLYDVTGDERAGEIVSKWVDWAIANTQLGADGDFAVPSDLDWSGQPDDWNPDDPGDNSGLSVEVLNHTQDVGVTASYVKTLLHYAAESGDAEAQATGEALLDALLANQTDIGIAIPESRADYERFDDAYDPGTDQGLYIPEGWTGTMPNGDVIDSDSTFTSIRSFYEDDPDWPQVQAYLDGGEPPTFTYHRFWAQAEIATALALHAELFGAAE
ncbi:hypothetical protein FHR81_002312 [Actinoalloteichus hoggarensis]|uniref:Exoglucanase B n=1 Tax=Actinoalloteichus hoggarensis TaxID=1470176 RepID=A0A221W6F8_9PSEU|nr:glycoside hydrolase family 48 protein [Actinoalloteichus hoggarensis]ASO21341.1 Exoglucanase B precursor [Actinoalloteichus hoggarensis]MBB5921274.1 hypothetical protein [Actinoalloteichus hoggarensis]